MRPFAVIAAVTTTTSLLAALGWTACGGARQASSDMTREGDGQTSLEDGGHEAGLETGGEEGDGGDAPDLAPHPCLNPVPVLLGDADIGFDSCQGGGDFSNGYLEGVRRRVAIACPSFLPRASKGACPLPDASPFASGYTFPISEICRSDDDCSAKANSHCEPWSPDGGIRPSDCRCSPGCLQDSDCAASEVCLCGNPVGICVPASCASSTSCNSGYDCIVSSPGCGPPRFDCQAPTDTCFPTDRCDSGICAEHDGSFTCSSNGPVCGI
jgi:hypothetical protein